MSISFRELIQKHCGGVRGGWDNLLQSFRRGIGAARPCRSDSSTAQWTSSRPESSNPALRAAAIVMDKSTDIICAIARLSYFYKHESCFQCTPCREGAGWMWRVMERMVQGRAQKREIDMLLDVTKQVEGNPPRALRDAAAWPIQGPTAPIFALRSSGASTNMPPYRTASRCSRRRKRAACTEPIAQLNIGLVPLSDGRSAHGGCLHGPTSIASTRSPSAARDLRLAAQGRQQQ